MTENDQVALRETFVSIERQVRDMRSHLDEKLVTFSTDRYPKNGTRLECLLEGLGGVAAMAALAAEQVADEVPSHV